MADLLVCFWDQPLDAERALAAYVTIGMPNQSHTAVQNLLLGSLHSAATTAEDWRYIGQHALPLVLPTWVQFGETGMRECISGVDLELDLPDMETFVTILGNSQTCDLLASLRACLLPIHTSALHQLLASSLAHALTNSLTQPCTEALKFHTLSSSLTHPHLFTSSTVG